MNFLENPALLLAIAALLDFLIGDPWNWLHPVQVMGWAIGRYGRWVQTWLALTPEPVSVQRKVGLQRTAGVLLAIALVLGSGAIGWLIVHASRTVHPLLGLAAESILLASCFAGRSLRDAAADVLQPLSRGDLSEARSHLSRYVGRDTENLPEPEILRAVLETVTENATDGVTAPLFWAIAGSFIPLGPIPLALGYKAASTLDSMVGYKAAPYTHLGWASARLDDLLTWLPCRLTVLTIALISGRPGHVLKLCRRDAPQDPSPNAGWSECAYAAALDVQVGGQNTYRGKITHKPLLADPVRPITSERIQQALNLTRRVFLLWLAGAIALHHLSCLRPLLS
ncbi:MAG: adenosylcobinamide-phosphate synthase CbiB [Cyanobacteriota bacterium]